MTTEAFPIVMSHAACGWRKPHPGGCWVLDDRVVYQYSAGALSRLTIVGIEHSVQAFPAMNRFVAAFWNPYGSRIRPTCQSWCAVVGWSRRERVRSLGAWNDRVVEADGDLVSDQRVQAINRFGRLVECSGFDES